MGELSEIFQWRGESAARGLVGFSSEDKRHVGEEMSDVRFRHEHTVLLTTLTTTSFTSSAIFVFSMAAWLA